LNTIVTISELNDRRNRLSIGLQYLQDLAVDAAVSSSLFFSIIRWIFFLKG
jgi:hypothetical protein